MCLKPSGKVSFYDYNFCDKNAIATRYVLKSTKYNCALYYLAKPENKKKFLTDLVK